MSGYQVDVQLVRQGMGAFLREGGVIDNLLEEVRVDAATPMYMPAPGVMARGPGATPYLLFWYSVSLYQS
jgi:hypothetical protein